LSKWPAVDVTSAGDPDLVLAMVDDFSPTAVEPRDRILRLFFSTATTRDAAHAALNAAGYPTERIDVDDEDWARRSQADLQPITVGRITITPAPRTLYGTQHSTQHPAPSTAPGTHHPAPGTRLVILPSTGFGTGHHATTRLCLRALQSIDLTGRSVLDVGTGSGVLALAAVMLGAGVVRGIDYDADAIRAAIENLELNPGLAPVEFRVADLSQVVLPAADVVTANLTGSVLIRSARRLIDLVRPAGTLIVSGLLEDERDAVVEAFSEAARQQRPPSSNTEKTPESFPGLQPVSEQREDGWVALGLCCN
jgi:ribosomal protein L11 methyltransferase